MHKVSLLPLEEHKGRLLGCMIHRELKDQQEKRVQSEAGSATIEFMAS